MGRNDIIKNSKCEQYRDLRNYCRMNLFISCDCNFLITGRAGNAYP